MVQLLVGNLVRTNQQSVQASRLSLPQRLHQQPLLPFLLLRGGGGGRP
jgi:hypothetical protein